MSTLAGAAICLALRFEWNGQVLRAGRRPAYGVEVPNVKRQPEPPGARESILYPLSPAPFRQLAGMGAAGQPIAVVLQPALPPTPGELKVRLSIAACPGAAAAPPSPGARAPEFRVSVLLPVTDRPGAGARRATAASGVLTEVAPLDLVLPFPHEAELEEEIQLVVAAATGPEAQVVLTWSRFRHPGQERFVWHEPAAGGSGRGDPGRTMTDPTRQQWWLDYKAAWELAGNFKNEAALQAWLMQKPQRWSDRDAQIDERLLGDLELLVQIRAANRRMALNPGRGDRVAPDYVAELRASTEELERSLRVIERLRQLGWKDPWIETGLARYAAFVMEVVKAQADRVELDQGRATAQVLEARALVARVGPGRPLPP